MAQISAERSARDLTAREIAAHLGVSVQSVSRWAAEGKITRRRENGRYLYSGFDFDVASASLALQLERQARILRDARPFAGALS